MINRIQHMPPHFMQSMLHVVQVPPDWNGTILMQSMLHVVQVLPDWNGKIKGLSVGARSLVTWTNTKKNVV